MNSDNERGLIPYPVIKAATEGNPEAVEDVLRHYEKYIAHLSVQKMFDERGYSRWIVNNEIRELLREKLIIAILSFNA